MAGWAEGLRGGQCHSCGPFHASLTLCPSPCCGASQTLGLCKHSPATLVYHILMPLTMGSVFSQEGSCQVLVCPGCVVGQSLGDSCLWCLSSALCHSNRKLHC